MGSAVHQGKSASRPVVGGDIPITPLFMLLFGVFTSLYGVLLVPISMGLLPYDSVSADSLLLIVFAIMIAFFGVTPVGTFVHSWFLFAVGMLLSILASLSFLAPDTFGTASSMVFGVILLAMGFVRMPLFLAKRAQEFAQLPSSYVVLFYLMHVLCVLLGLNELLPNMLPQVVSTASLILLGTVQLALGFLSFRIERENPGSVPSATKFGKEAEGNTPENVSLKNMLSLLLASIMILTAVISLLGAFRILHVGTEGTNALFLFVTAMQLMLSGDTPVGSFGPSKTLVILGVVTAALAMAASIVPGVLDGALGTVMGVANLLSAVFGCYHMAKLVRDTAGHRSRAVTGSIITGTALYILLFVFAANMLVPGLVPGLLMLLVLLLSGIMMIGVVVLTRKA